jgi:hypothetical protein
VLFGGNSTASFVEYSNSFVVMPAVSYDFSGRSVSNAGDVNGDGYDDLIVGVPYASRCYVLFGNRFGFSNMTKGFTIFGILGSDQTGWAVSGAGKCLICIVFFLHCFLLPLFFVGDVNNDTFADIIVGAPNALNYQGVSTGAVYVLFGNHSNHLFDIQLSELTSDRGFAVYGQNVQDCAGVSVSGAG